MTRLPVDLSLRKEIGVELRELHGGQRLPLGLAVKTSFRGGDHHQEQDNEDDGGAGTSASIVVAAL